MNLPQLFRISQQPNRVQPLTEIMDKRLFKSKKKKTIRNVTIGVTQPPPQGSQRRISKYPTKFPHEPMDSKTKEESENSEEPPKGDKLGILRLIRYKTTPKPISPNIFDKEFVRKLVKNGDEISRESLHSLKHMNISSDALERIMEIVNRNNHAVSNLTPTTFTKSYGYDPTSTHYFVSFIFIIYAFVLFCFFKLKIKILNR